MNTRHYSECLRGRKRRFFGAASFFDFFAALLIPPEITKPKRRELRVADRVSNVLMAQVVLDGARVVPLVRSSESAWRHDDHGVPAVERIGSADAPRPR